MEKDKYIAFLKGNSQFIEEVYPHLNEKDKKSLWVYLLAYDLMSRNLEVSPLDKFTHSSYLEWKSIEPNIDELIEHVIDEYFSDWDIWFEGAKERTVKEEVFRRIGKE